MDLLRREVLAAANVSLFSTFLQIIFMAYLGIHLDTFQTAALVIGFVFGVRNFVQIFFRIPIGEFSQVVGRKPLILIGMTFYSIAHFVLFLSNSWVYDLVATIFLAFGMTFHYPSLFAYIGDISEDNYGKINGFVFQGSDVAVIVGTFAVKILLEDNIIELSTVFLGAFVFGIFGVVVNYFILTETLTEKDRMIVSSKIRSLGTSFRNSIRSFIKMSKNKKLRPVYQFQFMVAFGEFFFQSFIGLLIVKSLDFEDSDVAAVLSIGTLILFPIKSLLGTISDRFGYKKPIVVSLTLNGILLFLITQATELWMVTVIYAVYMANNITSYLGVNGATSYNSEDNKRGVAMGVLGVYVSLGRTLSSLLMGVTWQILTNQSGDKGTSLKTVFQITGVILIATAFYFAIRVKTEVPPLNKTLKGGIVNPRMNMK